MSGLGKGVCSASVAKILSLSGVKVTCVKVDPYLNVDAGTMNPVMHGEVFVTNDGGETDMDIGTYERFLDQELSSSHNITTGTVYLDVIKSERRGEQLGECIQIIPHITNEIKKKIKQIGVKSKAEVVIVECGGTIGDIESLPFLESFRQMKLEEEESQCAFIHVTLAPEIEPVNEQKTKPTQHSVQELRRIGIQPDIIVVRCKRKLTKEVKNKIALFTSVSDKCVISSPDVKTVYEVPKMIAKEGIIDAINNRLKTNNKVNNWDKWDKITKNFSEMKNPVKIAMVGKYVTISDSYASVNEALSHAAANLKSGIKVDWIDSEELENNKKLMGKLKEYHGILIPGGFGTRGIEGKISTAEFAYKNNIPFFGICLGFQISIIALSRTICNLKQAHSTEFDSNTQHPVIDLLPEQKKLQDMGATMRLGNHEIVIKEGTLASKIYNSKIIKQRHRHRYELNQEYKEMLESKSIRFSGWSDNGKRIEIMEIENHPFYIATQYHPEFISRPGTPEKVFKAFVEASIKNNKKN